LRAVPNIRDVAERAGVSISTVSRVLNDSGPASVKAREVVLRAVSETGFRPNTIGRKLKTAKSRTVGVLVPSLKNPIFADAVQGIERAAEKEGYGVLLTSSNYAPEKEVEAVEVFLSNRVEGLIVTVADETSSPALELLRRESVPFVLVFNPALDPGPSAVTIDNRAAARRIVKELIALGHRRIAMIAGSFQASDRSGLRRAGYEQALAEHGLDPGPVVEEQQAPPQPPTVDPIVQEAATDARPKRTGPADTQREIAHMAKLRSVAQQDPGRALRMVKAGRRRFPSGLFAQERDAIEVLSLAELGRDARAQTKGASFLRNHPQSAFVSRVKKALKEIFVKDPEPPQHE